MPRFVAVSLLALTLTACSRGPQEFLGLPEDQERKLGDASADADPRLKDTVTMTKVQTVPYATYESAKAAGRITAQDRRGQWIYYATQELKSIPLAPTGPVRLGVAPPKTSFTVNVTNRFKTEGPPLR